MLGWLIELALELLVDGCFGLIRRKVKYRFVRAVLYVITVCVFSGIAIGLFLLSFYAAAGIIGWILELLLALFS